MLIEENEIELHDVATELIEDIFLFKKERANDLTLLETIIEYAHYKDIPLQEIGNSIADHKEYTEIFRKTLINEGYFRDEDYQPTKMIEEEW